MSEPDVASRDMIVKADEHVVDITLLLDRLGAGPRRTVVHVGAHAGEEVPAYFAAGFGRVILVDANPDACTDMRRRFASEPRVAVIHAAVVAEPGPVDFHLHTSRSGSVESASVLPMKELKRIVKAMHTPRTVQVPGETLDALLRHHRIPLDECDLLNLDVQGAELLVLRGGSNVLRACRWLISEINRLELYENGAREGEVERFVGVAGLVRAFTIYHQFYDEHGWFVAWGEALFSRTSMSSGERGRPGVPGPVA